MTGLLLNTWVDVSIKERIENLVEEGKFKNVSTFIREAIEEHLERHPSRKERIQKEIEDARAKAEELSFL